MTKRIIKIIRFLSLWVILAIVGLMGILFIEVLLTQRFGSSLVFPSVLIWLVWVVATYPTTRLLLKKISKFYNGE
tara:strand:+ start:301 stop:525 length:225 start_codon:yes stop_codon:yes gene_type:complete